MIFDVVLRRGHPARARIDDVHREIRAVGLAHHRVRDFGDLLLEFFQLEVVLLFECAERRVELHAAGQQDDELLPVFR